MKKYCYDEALHSNAILQCAIPGSEGPHVPEGAPKRCMDGYDVGISKGVEAANPPVVLRRFHRHDASMGEPEQAGVEEQAGRHL